MSFGLLFAYRYANPDSASSNHAISGTLRAAVTWVAPK